MIAVVALAGCGAGTAPEAPSVSTPSDIVALMDTPRLTSLSSTGRLITAEGQASTADGDDLRTKWFTTVAGVEYAQRFGGSFIVSKVVHDTTVLEKEETEVGTVSDPATLLSEEDLSVVVSRYANDAGVLVEEINYVPFFGGTAEFVLRPTDESKFMHEFDKRMYLFFRHLVPSDRKPRPVLVTIVDDSGAIRLVQGSIPLSDEGTAQYGRDENGQKYQIAEGEGMSSGCRRSHEALGLGNGGGGRRGRTRVVQR